MLSIKGPLCGICLYIGYNCMHQINLVIYLDISLTFQKLVGIHIYIKQEDNTGTHDVNHCLEEVTSHHGLKTKGKNEK